MTGAGISVSAGIPDFRTPGTGLYDNLGKYNLPHPTAVFELPFFKTNPKPFFILAKELYPGNYAPTKCHYFIRMLDEKGVLLRNFTQNIDTLEREAGMNPEQLVEAHGSFGGAACISCKHPHSPDFVRTAIFADQIPMCSACNSHVVKPNIVFFGEGLPDRFFKLVKKDFPQCDLLLVIGTSLAVHPFASLVNMVENTVPRVLINREAVGPFTSKTRPGGRDVAALGDIEATVADFVRLLGWEDEFNGNVAKWQLERTERLAALASNTADSQATTETGAPSQGGHDSSDNSSSESKPAASQ
eukprot:TRINITY_DN3983_c0_g1_i3.p1 TRINITY_DN3983_c0_g1~~TRINITY_DN3983_c0_g1_i3.p1  ORF type:complete len:301 (+),score=49.50 TRINITY_DN3983_c0_g1_i3:453-1355(+)